jgi:hypothetical protein
MSVSNQIIGKGDTRTRVPIHCDDNGNLYFVGAIAAPGGAGVPASLSSNALAASMVIAAVPAVLFDVTVANTTAADAFLLLFDAVALPGNGAIPKAYAAIPAGWTGSISYDTGRGFATGIVAAMSTTLGTLTVAGASFLFSARFST